jgi:hypothetical protein
MYWRKALPAFLCVAAILAVIIFVARMDGGPSSSTLDAGLRAHRIQQCIGTAPPDKSFSEWTTELANRAARAGVTTDAYQALAWQIAERKNPGVTERCKAR